MDNLIMIYIVLVAILCLFLNVFIVMNRYIKLFLIRIIRQLTINKIIKKDIIILLLIIFGQLSITYIMIFTISKLIH